MRLQLFRVLSPSRWAPKRSSLPAHKYRYIPKASFGDPQNDPI